MKRLVAKVAARLACSEAQARLALDAVLSVLAEGASARGFGRFVRRGDKLSFRQAKVKHGK